MLLLILVRFAEVLLGIMFILSVINIFSKNIWFCTFWGWHEEPEYVDPKQFENSSKGYDEVLVTGICPRCGKKIPQNSKGTWF